MLAPWVAAVAICALHTKHAALKQPADKSEPNQISYASAHGEASQTTVQTKKTLATDAVSLQCVGVTRSRWYLEVVERVVLGKQCVDWS